SDGDRFTATHTRRRVRIGGSTDSCRRKLKHTQVTLPRRARKGCRRFAGGIQLNIRVTRKAANEYLRAARGAGIGGGIVYGDTGCPTRLADNNGTGKRWSCITLDRK